MPQGIRQNPAYRPASFLLETRNPSYPLLVLEIELNTPHIQLKNNNNKFHFEYFSEVSCKSLS
jgi:hypothetical protein